MRWIQAVSCLAVILFNFFCTYAGSFKVLKILIIFNNIQLCLWSMVCIRDQTKLPAIRRDHTIWGRVFTCLQHFFGMRHLPNLHSARSIFMTLRLKEDRVLAFHFLTVDLLHVSALPRPDEQRITALNLCTPAWCTQENMFIHLK